METRREYLTDEQWSLISPLIPPAPIRADGKGRPLEHNDRYTYYERSSEGIMNWCSKDGLAR